MVINILEYEIFDLKESTIKFWFICLLNINIPPSEVTLFKD